MIEIVFPNDRLFLANLIIQRTGSFTEIGGREALRTWFRTGEKAQLYNFLSDNKLIETYLRETVAACDQEALALVSELPPDCFHHIVSIGPGNGLLELCLFKKTRPKSLLLIDIEESEIHQAGFAEAGSGYASLSATRNFLVSNGVPNDAIKTNNPRFETPPDFKFDLLISMLSMGFHYPCDDYVGFVSRNMKSNSWIVLDKRNDASDAGFDKIRKSFRVETQVPMEKCSRVFMMRGGSH
jgi:hypothetical protein